MNWKAALAVFFTFVIADFIWLGSVMQGFYVSQIRGIGRIENDKFQVVYWAAFLTYLLMTFGMSHFVFPRLAPDDSHFQVWLTGAAFGLVMFGVYDMTNMSTLERWPVRMVWIDICWGIFLCAVTTSFAYQVGLWLR